VLPLLRRELAAAEDVAAALLKEYPQLSVSSPRLAMHQAGQMSAYGKLPDDYHYRMLRLVTLRLYGGNIWF